MIPIITVITPYHGTTIIRFVASGTNPDLVSPLISDLRRIQITEELMTHSGEPHSAPPCTSMSTHHVCTDGLGHDAADWCFEGRGRREHGGRGEQR